MNASLSCLPPRIPRIRRFLPVVGVLVSFLSTTAQAEGCVGAYVRNDCPGGVVCWSLWRLVLSFSGSGPG
jgi:hypothetical protein